MEWITVRIPVTFETRNKLVHLTSPLIRGLLVAGRTEAEAFAHAVRAVEDLGRATESEVMSDRTESRSPSGPDKTPPQPAPSPAGAMELLELIERRDIEHNLFDCPSGGYIRQELARLRFAPPVTEEMVELAAHQIHCDMGCTITAARISAARALTAALTPGGK